MILILICININYKITVITLQRYGLTLSLIPVCDSKRCNELKSSLEPVMRWSEIDLLALITTDDWKMREKDVILHIIPITKDLHFFNK